VPPGAAQLARANDAARTFPPALIEVFIEPFPPISQAWMIDESCWFFNRQFLI
jgi:hypothetical protein